MSLLPDKMWGLPVSKESLKLLFFFLSITLISLIQLMVQDIIQKIKCYENFSFYETFHETVLRQGKASFLGLKRATCFA